MPLKGYLSGIIELILTVPVPGSSISTLMVSISPRLNCDFRLDLVYTGRLVAKFFITL